MNCYTGLSFEVYYLIAVLKVARCTHVVILVVLCSCRS